MGATQAMGMAEAVSDGDIGLRQAIGWHLSANHFPPVPADMIDPCIQAIEYAADEDWDAEVELPEGTEYRGSTVAPVWAIVEAHHLQAFIGTYDEEEE